MRAWGTVNVLRLPNQSGIRIRGNQGKKKYAEACRMEPWAIIQGRD